MDKSAGSIEIRETATPEVAVTQALKRRDEIIANFVDQLEKQAMKPHRRDYTAHAAHDERLGNLLAAIYSAPAQAEEMFERYLQRRTDEHMWRQLQRRIPAKLREVILKDPCVYCGGEADTVDHMLPVSRGGTRDRDNLAPACWACNQEKADRTVAEWMKYRAEQGLPWPPTTTDQRIRAVIDELTASS